RHTEFQRCLEARARAQGAEDLAAYAALLEDPALRAAEARAVAAGLTVNETYFFREVEHLEALRDVVLPRVRAEGRALRVLSLGCSSGEEPYSVALLLIEAGVTPEELSILACDVSPEVIAKAERGLYSVWSLRKVPDELRSEEHTSELQSR